MAMGRVIESTFRSLNNLLEHLHQSFFFYLLMQANRFVSIGTYLPSAMLVAVNFTIMAIFLWVKSGRPNPTTPAIASTDLKEKENPALAIIEKDGAKALVPEQSLAIIERELFLPLAVVIGAQFLGLLPLYIFNKTPESVCGILECLLKPLCFAKLLRALNLVTTDALSGIHRILCGQCDSSFRGL